METAEDNFNYLPYVTHLRLEAPEFTPENRERFNELAGFFFMILENQKDNPEAAFQGLEGLKDKTANLGWQLYVAELTLNKRAMRDIRQKLLEAVGNGAKYQDFLNAWADANFLEDYRAALNGAADERKDAYAAAAAELNGVIAAMIVPQGSVRHGSAARKQALVNRFNEAFKETPDHLEINPRDVMAIYIGPEHEFLALFDSLYHKSARGVRRHDFKDLKKISHSGIINSYVKVEYINGQSEELQVSGDIKYKAFAKFLEDLRFLWQQRFAAESDNLVRASAYVAHKIYSGHLGDSFFIEYHAKPEDLGKQLEREGVAYILSMRQGGLNLNGLKSKLGGFFKRK